MTSVGSRPRGVDGRQAAAQPPVAVVRSPERLAGMSLAELRDDCYRRLFGDYLPFWENGALDWHCGGIVCELASDGSIVDDVKDLTCQGRGLWVYSFLHNHFGRSPAWLDRAELVRRFLVDRLYAGDGQWRHTSRGDGAVLDGLSPTVLGGLYAAEGLIEHHRATGRREDLALATETVRAALRAYDSPGYDHAQANYAVARVPARGLRSLGHSMVFLRVLSQWPMEELDPELRAARDEHLDAVMNRFWHTEYGIFNEFLKHDYSRFPAYEGCMYSGHAIETVWIVLDEAVRRGDRRLFETARQRLRRLLEMTSDYVFGGLASGDFLVFDLPPHGCGPRYDVKAMWVHCEAMIGCMMVLEDSGDGWARDWYERIRRFALSVMSGKARGVWRQAVDRRGNDHVRREHGFSPWRRDNYHQARWLMLNLLSLQRMLDRTNDGVARP